MLVTLGPSVMILDLNMLLIHDDNYCFFIILASCIHISLSGTRGLCDRNWDNWRGWLWCEDHMCSQSVNPLLQCFIKISTLITSSFPWGPTANGLVGQKMLCKFSLRARATIYGTHAYGYLVLGRFIIIYLPMPMSCYYMNYLIHATPVHPSLCLQYF